MPNSPHVGIIYQKGMIFEIACLFLLHLSNIRRQNILIGNIKKDAAPIDTKNPVVSVFTIYHCVHDAVVLFREEMIRKLQVIAQDNRIFFVNEIVPGTL